ncbi:MAG: hypothetical protein HC869_08765 [Rhodospirillales bacterium]|nr:hypothetical protein [Rhodospirillales bacterium]
MFFYQSPNGGRVFFDELGPPWQKHPCTDSRSIPKAIAPAVFPERANSDRSYRWQRDGWKPFFVLSVSRVDKSILRTNGSLEGKPLAVFYYNDINRFDGSPHITNVSIVYLKKEDEDRYELSLIVSAPPGHMTVDAFASLLAARGATSATSEGGGEAVASQRLASYRRDRAAEEDFLSLVARHEIGGHEVPRLPRNLISRLQSIVASKGGVLSWAHSHPMYAVIKTREQSKLRRAAKIRRRIEESRRKTAATKWKTKGRRK